jgi:hypothetical protein
MGHEVTERERIADAPSIGRAGDRFIGVAEPRRTTGLAVGP